MSKSNKLKISTSNLGGYHYDPEIGKWPSGSIFENEGKRLYDLVRKLKPLLIVEIGGFVGCSTSWMAKAIRDNKKGKIISIDNNVHAGEWSLIPEELREFVEQRTADAFTCDVPEKIDMVFEDGMHSPWFTKKIIQRFKPSMAFVSHDYCHKSDPGYNVKREFDEMLGEPDEVFFEKPSDCGLAIKYM